MLSNVALDQYRQQGFLVVQGLFDADECEFFRAASQRAENRVLEKIQSTPETAEYHLDGNRFVDIEHVTVQFEHTSQSKKLRVIEPVQDVEPVFNELIDDIRLSGPMRQLVPGESLALWTAKLNLKHPQIGSGFGWHQDAPYWIHASAHVHKLPNVMVFFDDAHAENGCFRVIKGSHRDGCLPGCEDDRQLAGFFTNPKSFDLGDEVLIEAPAGSAVFFDPHIVHGSGENSGESPRRAIIITYQPAGFAALKSGQVRPVN